VIIHPVFLADGSVLHSTLAIKPRQTTSPET